jgi:hypothetical protein
MLAEKGREWLGNERLVKKERLPALIDTKLESAKARI